MQTFKLFRAASDSGAVQGPEWDLSSEYPSIDSNQFKADVSALEAAIAALVEQGKAIGARVASAASLDAGKDAAFLTQCRQFAPALEHAQILLGNLATYTSCVSSTDGSNAQAKTMRGILDGLGSRLNSASAAFFLVLTLAPDAFVDAFCAVPETKALRFSLDQSRKLRNRTLPLDVERALSTLGPDGYTAWGNLYDNLTGTVRCVIKMPDGTEKTTGLSGAASLLKGADRAVREAAWRAINTAMAGNQEAFAAILNSISGWRYAEAGMRSYKEPVHFLDTALHQSRISRATLDTLMGVLKESLELGRQALRLQAKAYGVDRLGPWDTLAPAPALGGRETAIPFAQGLATVRRAYASIDESMGTFVDSMSSKRRIEGRVMDGKRPGAFCTEFPRSRNPFVYTTYRGALSELSTLSHELGHAYHCEVMRDIPVAESEYPMTLAETASTFAETVLGEILVTEAKDEDSLFELAWADAQDAATFLVNIPARFEFESRFYTRRPEGPVGPDALRKLMSDSWQEWYGDSLSGYDDYFWASKLHFHKTGTSFYNFPYSFGYLFSLGVFARKEALGAGFHKAYVALLRDTGRMEAEELASRHLGVDITKPDFWRASIEIVKAKVERFQKMVEKRF